MALRDSSIERPLLSAAGAAYLAALGTGTFYVVSSAEPEIDYALAVQFDVWEVGALPLTVQFDIGGLGPAQFTPLTVRFDVVQELAPGLTVTFDVLGALVSRRLTSDIQGPAAEADLS